MSADILFFNGIYLKDCLESPEANIPDYEFIDEEFDDEIDMLANQINIVSGFNTSSSTDTFYSSIPGVFLNMDTWTKKTNLLCWYCSRGFDTFPWFIPNGVITVYVDIDNVDSNGNPKIYTNPGEIEWSVKTVPRPALRPYGNFCTSICANSYMHTIKDKSVINIEDSKQQLLSLHNKILGLRDISIPIKPFWIIIKKYCGNNGVSEEQYYQWQQI